MTVPRPDLVGDAGHAVHAYLAEIDARLVGPTVWRAEVLAELRDGLEVAIESYLDTGVNPDVIQRLVVADFGDPGIVADGFVGEAAALQARRVAGRLLATAPVVAGSWLATFITSGVPMLHGELAGPWRAMPLIGLVLAVAVPAALLAYTAAGRAATRFVGRPRLAPAAAATAAGLCAVGDVVMLAMFGAWIVVAGRGFGTAAFVVGGFAAAVSLTRLVVASIAARRCLAVGVRLT